MDMPKKKKKRKSGMIELIDTDGAVEANLGFDPNAPLYCTCRWGTLFLFIFRSKLLNNSSFIARPNIVSSNGNMVGCDNEDCKIEWFHYECVGLVAAVRITYVTIRATILFDGLNC